MKGNKFKWNLILVFVLLVCSLLMFGGCGEKSPQEESVIVESTELLESQVETQTATTETIAELETESETVSSEVQSETETIAESEVVETEITEEPSEFDIVAEQIGLTIDNIEIDLPNVSNAYELLFISDMHIIGLDDSLPSHELENIKIRQEVMFQSKTGMRSSDVWLQLCSVLDDFSADHIIFGGDIVDFTSDSNLRILQEGLSQINTPYTYLRADHDMGNWYSNGAFNGDDAIKMHAEICDYEDAYILEYPEFYVIGWNNSTSQLSNAALHKILSVWEKGKPIILATHVPLNSAVDNSLAEQLSQTDPEGRIKLWGEGCLYQPRENTSSFMGMIFNKNSPVKAVFGGHLHFKHTIPLTNQITEYILAPAFEGNITKITIK